MLHDMLQRKRAELVEELNAVSNLYSRGCIDKGQLEKLQNVILTVSEFVSLDKLLHLLAAFVLLVVSTAGQAFLIL